MIVGLLALIAFIGYAILQAVTAKDRAQKRELQRQRNAELLEDALTYPLRTVTYVAIFLIGIAGSIAAVEYGHGFFKTLVWGAFATLGSFLAAIFYFENAEAREKGRSKHQRIRPVHSGQTTFQQWAELSRADKGAVALKVLKAVYGAVPSIPPTKPVSSYVGALDRLMSEVPSDLLPTNVERALLNIIRADHPDDRDIARLTEVGPTI